MAVNQFDRGVFPLHEMGVIKTHQWKVTMMNKMNELQREVQEDALTQEQLIAKKAELAQLVYTYGSHLTLKTT